MATFIEKYTCRIFMDSTLLPLSCVVDLPLIPMPLASFNQNYESQLACMEYLQGIRMAVLEWSFAAEFLSVFGCVYIYGMIWPMAQKMPPNRINNKYKYRSLCTVQFGVVLHHCILDGTEYQALVLFCMFF